MATGCGPKGLGEAERSEWGMSKGCHMADSAHWVCSLQSAAEFELASSGNSVEGCSRESKATA